MPDETRLVVVNTTPIISLSLVSQLPLLRKLYQRVVIPPAVREEALRGGSSGVGVAELREADWIHTMRLQDPRRADLLSDLDRGEAEVLALAQEAQAGLVVIDERLARRHAQRLGIPLTGTLGVLLKAKQRGFLTEVKPLIEKIQRGGIRLGRLLIEQALRLAEED
jgi:predicted nucleic acid-binding protein